MVNLIGQLGIIDTMGGDLIILFVAQNTYDRRYYYLDSEYGEAKTGYYMSEHSAYISYQRYLNKLKALQT